MKGSLSSKRQDDETVCFQISPRNCSHRKKSLLKPYNETSGKKELSWRGGGALHISAWRQPIGGEHVSAQGPADVSSHIQQSEGQWGRVTFRAVDSGSGVRVWQQAR